MFAAERKGESINSIDFDDTVLTTLGLSMKYMNVMIMWHLYTTVTPIAPGHKAIYDIFEILYKAGHFSANS